MATGLFLLLSVSAHADPAKILERSVLPLVGNLKVHRTVFDNGLKLLVVPDDSSPTFAFQIWYRVGSRDENVKYTGLAHLFEHMMFKDTKNRPDGEFDRVLEQAGAEGGNAYTTQDVTVYIQELPKGKLDLIMELEADRMVNLIVNDKSFKTETNVVQNERKFRYENNPDGKIYQEGFDMAFTKHPYHWPVIGYREDLDRMTADDARKFYEAHYIPSHATIVISGAVTPEEGIAATQKFFGNLKDPTAQATAKPADRPAEPEQKAARKRELRLNMQVPKITVSYRIPGTNHADIPALRVALGILSNGKSSRIHKALVDSGVASNADCYEHDHGDPTLAMFFVGLQKGKSPALAEKLLLAEIAKLAKTPPSAEEMKRIRNRLSFGFYEGLNSNPERARFLGHFESISGSFEAGLKQFKTVMDVQANDVSRVIAKYFKPEARNTVVGMPK